MLQTLHAMPGQTVGAGAPLFDLVAIDAVWLKVPVYAGDVDAIDGRAPVEVVPLGAPSGTPALVARRHVGRSLDGLGHRVEAGTRGERWGLGIRHVRHRTLS